MKVLLRISRFPGFPAKKKTAQLITSKCVSANKWEVLHIRVRKCLTAQDRFKAYLDYYGVKY